MVTVTCFGVADPGWELVRERWDINDGWIEEIFVANESQTSVTIAHVFGERYRFTMTPGSSGGEVPDTEFLPVGQHEPYWQEEANHTEFFVKDSVGKYQKTQTLPSTGSSSTANYQTPPQQSPTPPVRVFQTFLPHFNLPPCLLHNNNRDEYKDWADHEDPSLLMEKPEGPSHPTDPVETGVLMFNDLMKGTEKPLLYVAPAHGRILKTPLTDFRLVLNNPLAMETGRLRFHALRHRRGDGTPLVPSLEKVIDQDISLRDQFLLTTGSYFGWEFFVEGIAEGVAPYSLEWRFDSNLNHVISGKIDVLPRQLAFSDNLSVAEGFGKWSIGGRCGGVIQVTTTEDYLPGSPPIAGSLRAALAEPGPKTINFDGLSGVGDDGTIALKAPLVIDKPFVTINGHTAPGMGICLRDEPLLVKADHVIIRYIRSRPGDTTGGTRYPLKSKENDHDSFTIADARHVILDHCSASWGIDETISIGDKGDETDNVTVQWCLMSNGLRESIHSKTHREGLAHGYGSIFNAARGAKYTIHHSMYAHIVRRNPRFQNKWAPPADPLDLSVPEQQGDPVGGYIDFRNNIVYNWGNLGGRPAAGMNFDGKIGSLLSHNLTNNYYKTGSDTNKTWEPPFPRFIIMEEFNDKAKSHYSGNQMDIPGGSVVPADQRELINQNGGTWDLLLTPFPMDHPGTPIDVRYGEPDTDDASELPLKLEALVGASKSRDPVDDELLLEFDLRTGAIIDSQDEFEYDGRQGWPILPLHP